MTRWAEILHEEFSSKGYKIPTEPESKDPPKGSKGTWDDSRMRNVLGMTPHDFRATITDMANSVIEQGIKND